MRRVDAQRLNFGGGGGGGGGSCASGDVSDTAVLAASVTPRSGPCDQAADNITSQSPAGPLKAAPSLPQHDPGSRGDSPTMSSAASTASDTGVDLVSTSHPAGAAPPPPASSGATQVPSSVNQAPAPAAPRVAGPCHAKTDNGGTLFHTMGGLLSQSLTELKVLITSDDSRLGGAVRWLTGAPAPQYKRMPQQPVTTAREGIKIEAVAGAILAGPHWAAEGVDEQRGILQLTLSELVFVPGASNGPSNAASNTASAASSPVAETPSHASLTSHTLPYYMVTEVRLGTQVCAGGGGSVTLVCRDFTRWLLKLPQHSLAVLVAQSVAAMSAVLLADQLPAFQQQANPTAADNTAEPWAAERIQQDFERMGVPGTDWRRSSANDTYALCSTYPRALYVPARIDDDTLGLAANYRSRGRFPVLSFRHRNSATITRCAQPLKGLLQQRSDADEQLVRAIFAASSNQNLDRREHIVDCRPHLNAVANMANGKGFESEDHYGSHCRLSFRDIPNIHVMREALRMLLDASHDMRLARALSVAKRQLADGAVPSATALDGAVRRWQADVQASNWLAHVESVLKSAAFVASLVDGRCESVLVHCSDGWDRSTQLTSLSQLVMEPFYRTMEGFAVLLEKEWLGFGHKFSDRCGFLYHCPDEVSPIFTQFLDCVWQLQRRDPNSFEFNERFLVQLHHEIMGCKFGNFLFNTDQERHSKHQVQKNTRCIWPQLLEATELRNPAFVPKLGCLQVQSHGCVVFSALYAPWLQCIEVPS
eukprot:m.128177 g.128177  ORF g.128177 m.128177 type:complete len:763 (+) comp16729_c0_seq1:2824-5112(+)